jgi:hypothetical protein
MSAHSVTPGTLATKDANRAASFADELALADHARIATNRSLLLICSNQLPRRSFRRHPLVNNLLSTGFVDRR